MFMQFLGYFEMVMKLDSSMIKHPYFGAETLYRVLPRHYQIIVIFFLYFGMLPMEILNL